VYKILNEIRVHQDNKICGKMGMCAGINEDDSIIKKKEPVRGIALKGFLQ